MSRTRRTRAAEEKRMETAEESRECSQQVLAAAGDNTPQMQMLLQVLNHVMSISKQIKSMEQQNETGRSASEAGTRASKAGRGATQTAGSTNGKDAHNRINHNHCTRASHGEPPATAGLCMLRQGGGGADSPTRSHVLDEDHTHTQLGGGKGHWKHASSPKGNSRLNKSQYPLPTSLQGCVLEQ